MADHDLRQRRHVAEDGILSNRDRIGGAGNRSLFFNNGKFHIDFFLYDAYNINILKKINVRGFMDNNHLYNARVFKAFCDESRLMVLEMLQSGEKCACVLLEKLKISQPTLSHHMKILVDSGIVAARKEGKWTYYAISMEGSENAAQLLRELTIVTIDENDNCNAGCNDE